MKKYVNGKCIKPATEEITTMQKQVNGNAYVLKTYPANWEEV